MCCAHNKGKAKCLVFADRRLRRAGGAVAPCTRWRTVRRLAQSDDRCVGEVGGWSGGLTEDSRHGQGTVGGGMISCHLWSSQWLAELLRGGEPSPCAQAQGNDEAEGRKALALQGFLSGVGTRRSCGRALTDSLNTRGEIAAAVELTDIYIYI